MVAHTHAETISRQSDDSPSQALPSDYSLASSEPQDTMTDIPPPSPIPSPSPPLPEPFSSPPRSSPSNHPSPPPSPPSSPPPDRDTSDASSSSFSTLTLTSTPPPAKRTKRPTKSESNAQLLSLIDPIYLGQPIPSPPSTSHPHVSFSSITINRFPMTADVTKVPGDGQSFYSVGLDYERGEEGEEMGVEEWEMKRAHERKREGCPEVDVEKRKQVWTEAQSELENTDNELIQPHPTPSPSPPPPSPPTHTHDLRTRPTPSSSTISPPPSSSSPLRFSDIPSLLHLRLSRSRVGCSCRVQPGDRQTKTCTAPWLDKRSTPPAYQPLTAPDGHRLDEVVCECLLSGVGCNSNACGCFGYCCRNPHERYAFNVARVNAKRRRMVMGMKEAMKEREKEMEKETEEEGRDGKGKRRSRRRGRQRTSSV